MSTVTASPALVHASPAALWAALGYVSGKESNRDALESGASHVVNLTVTGDIDGQPVEQSFAGRLTVGKDSTRASASVPNIEQVVAAILAKLNPATREAICRDLPAEFAANGHSLPALSVGQVEQAQALLAALKTSKQVAVRGSVKCEYTLHRDEPTFNVVG